MKKLRKFQEIFWKFFKKKLPDIKLHVLKIFGNFKFYVQHFFRKIAQNFQKKTEILSTFSKSKKTVIFKLKIVYNPYINQNLVKISLKTQKIADFP